MLGQHTSRFWSAIAVYRSITTPVCKNRQIDKDRQLLARSQFLTTLWTVWFLGKNSVCVQMTWVGPLLLCVLIHPKEVLVAWRAAEPGLPESHGSSEEELAIPWSNLALAGHLHEARPAFGSAAPWHEHLRLLSVETTQGHCDRGLIFLLWHTKNTTPSHCRGR